MQKTLVWSPLCSEANSREDLSDVFENVCSNIQILLRFVDAPKGFLSPEG